MIALVSVLVVVLVSLLITRVATLALTMTGMSRENARFQARSALSGVGFTTSEAEAVVRHPVRRRIVLALMIVGSGGVVTAVATLILSFGHGASNDARAVRGLVLVAGLFVLWLLSRSQWFDRALAYVIGPVLERTGITARDYATLLGLEGDYAVHELQVEEGDWVAGRSLAELRLRDEGIVVLGIHRTDGTYVGVPHGDAVPRPDDVLVLYAHADRISELDDRRRDAAGDEAHERALARRRTEARQEAGEAAA